MTIRTRFTLLFLAIFSVLLLIFCLVIYFEAENHREQEFRKRLRNESITAAAIFFNKESISPDLYKMMASNQLTVLSNEDVKIFDDMQNLVYQSTNNNFEVDANKVSEVLNGNELFWHEGERQMYAALIPNESKKYVIITSAEDIYGVSKQENLVFILTLGGVFMVILGLGLGYYLIGSFLKPIKEIISGIDKIKESNLSTRLKEDNSVDEFSQLRKRFNQMIERLEGAFENQKAFVSHASHELRTPLTSITGQIQVSLLANDDKEELKKMIESVLEDVQQLNKLSNNLLDLTSIGSNSTKFKLSLVNVLELALQIRSNLLAINNDARVLITYDGIDENPPEMKGMESLLMIALLNLIDNGIKYSDDGTIEVNISEKGEKIQIIFENKGKGLSQKEIDLIYQPFMRGANSHKIKGHGIGLPLTKKIIELHQGSITLKSTPNGVTNFTVSLPKNI